MSLTEKIEAVCVVIWVACIAAMIRWTRDTKTHHHKDGRD